MKRVSKEEAARHNFEQHLRNQVVGLFEVLPKEQIVECLRECADSVESMFDDWEFKKLEEQVSSFGRQLPTLVSPVQDRPAHYGVFMAATDYDLLISLMERKLTDRLAGLTRDATTGQLYYRRVLIMRRDA